MISKAKKRYIEYCLLIFRYIFFSQMANIEVSLSSGTNMPRRRKGLSLGGEGATSSRTAPEVDSFSLASKQKSTEEIIQNLRDPFNGGIVPRQNIAIPSETEAMERELRRLKNETDNKRAMIRNLKTALESLDVTE